MQSAVTLQYTYLVGCSRGNSSASPPLTQVVFSVRPSSHSPELTIVLEGIPRLLHLPLLPRPLQLRSSNQTMLTGMADWVGWEVEWLLFGGEGEGETCSGRGQG